MLASCMEINLEIDSEIVYESIKFNQEVMTDYNNWILS